MGQSKNGLSSTGSLRKNLHWTKRGIERELRGTSGYRRYFIYRDKKISTPKKLSSHFYLSLFLCFLLTILIQLDCSFSSCLKEFELIFGADIQNRREGWLPARHETNERRSSPVPRDNSTMTKRRKWTTRFVGTSNLATDLPYRFDSFISKKPIDLTP